MVVVTSSPRVLANAATVSGFPCSRVRRVPCSRLCVSMSAAFGQIASFPRSAGERESRRSASFDRISPGAVTDRHDAERRNARSPGDRGNEDKTLEREAPAGLRRAARQAHCSANYPDTLRGIVSPAARVSPTWRDSTSSLRRDARLKPNKQRTHFARSTQIISLSFRT